VASSYHGVRRNGDQVFEGDPSQSFHEAASTSSAGASHIHDHNRMLKDQLASRSKQSDATTKMNIQKAMQSRAIKQEKEFNRLCTSISDAKAFLSLVDKNLELHDETNRNKTRRQFEDWNTNVHGNIQVNISKQVNKIDSKSLNQKKNEDYSKFLEITNRKSAIFRDIIIESECMLYNYNINSHNHSRMLCTNLEIFFPFSLPTLPLFSPSDDPLEPNRRAIKAKVAKLKDPTMIDKQKAEAEGAMLGPGASKASVKTGGKDTLPVELWASGKIEATPYGTFARMMGKGGEGGEEALPKVTKTNATMNSNVVFDHFSFPKGKEAIDMELPRGKRVFPTTVYSDPGRVFANADKNINKELEQIKLMYA